MISGVALLGYFYGVHDPYALSIFNSMALNTAIALALLSIAALLADPGAGWVGMVGSLGAGGGATRRQLAFVALPIIAGKLLPVAAAPRRTHGTRAALGSGDRRR